MRRSIVLLISAILIFLGTVFTTYFYMMQTAVRECARINRILISDISSQLNFNLDMQRKAAHSMLTGYFSYQIGENDTLITIKDQDLRSFHRDVYDILENFVMVNPQVCAAMFIIDPKVYPQEGGQCYAPIIERGYVGHRNIASNLDLRKSVSYNRIISTGRSTWRLPNPKSTIYGKAIIYYVPLYRENGEPFGLFAINVSYDILRDVLEATLPYSHEGSTISLVDEDDNVILSTDSVLQVLDDIDDEAFVYQHKVENAPFSIVTTCSAQAVYSEARKMQRIVFFVSGIGMLLMLLCCVVISRQIRIKVLRIASAEGELKMAANVQQSILKPAELHVADVDLRAIMRPAREAGGDLYDYACRENHTVFCIGDVSGKGMPAALFMTQVVSLFRSAVLQTDDPLLITKRINEVLAQDNPQMTFCTFFVGVIEHGTGRITFCNAGHNRPVIITSDSGAFYLDVKPNLPLGLIPDYQYQQENLILPQGARMLLYTDGVNEARNPLGQLYGDNRLLSTVSTIQSDLVIEKVLHSIDNFAATYPQSDDITLMLINVEQ